MVDSGRLLEEDSAQALKDIGFEPEMTRASGQVHGNGDVLAGPFMSECKFKSTEGFGLSKKDFDKAMNQSLQQGRELVFFQRNKFGQTIVSMDLNTWVRWMRLAVQKYREEEE